VAPARQFAADTAAVLPWLLRVHGAWPEPFPGEEDSTRRSLVPRFAVLGLDRAVAARVLDAGVETVRSVDVPAARSGADPEGPAPARPSLFSVADRIAGIVMPSYHGAIRREQWTRSARALGRFALELRLARVGHGAYPREPSALPVSAATGETAAYRLLDDGSVEIAFPEAEASWTDEVRSSDPSGKIRTPDFNLCWRLPR
jgi:hypothetical protein